MATTKIADIIVPEVYAPYVIEETVNKSALVQSGIVVPDPNMDVLAQKGGNHIDMPFFQDLTGDDEVLTDNAIDEAGLTPGNIGTGQDIARLLMRGRAWSVNDLAKALSGDDPLGAIVSMTGQWWAQKEQNILISLLKGVFSDNLANDSGDLVHDVGIVDGANAAAANLIGPEAIIDAQHLLGDAFGGITAMVCHSAVYARLRKNNLIDYVEDSDAKTRFAYYQDMRVIVDDACPKIVGQATPPAVSYIGDEPTSGYKYCTYLFGTGAIARGEGSPDVPVETDRDSLTGNDILVNRRHFILHPRGIKFTSSSVAGQSPTNDELATTANWDRVYEQKNIRLVQLVTNG